jgi:ABC transport system ATP-binding/permease protein
LIIIVDAPVVIGRSGGVTLRLLHPSISRRHATVTRVEGAFTIEDHDSRFGTFVNGARVRVASIRPGDRVQFGSTIAYRVEPEGLRRDIAANGMALAAEGLVISLSPDFSLSSLLDDLRHAEAGSKWADSRGGGRKQLIKDIGFRVEPDSFLGILGPSGAGKSTLLNCLASHLLPGRGRLIFDEGSDAYTEPDVYRTMLGHVSQDDVLYRSLTIRENLTFAARLRLGREASAAAVFAAIDQSLERVGLTDHADKAAAVLSGGQRKRLSVAIELLRRPRLLLLDEPTSGLDPASEAHLMEQLRHVARRGTTIICTTHMMDNLFLLDAVVALGLVDGIGRLAYSGPPARLLPHFRCRGFADLYELLSSGRFDPIASSTGASPTTAEARAAPDEHCVPPGIGLAEPKSDLGTPVSTQRLGIAELAASLTVETAWRQLLIVAQRGLRLVLRDWGLVLAMIAQPILLGLMVALTQYNVAKPFPILFFAGVIAIWLGLNNSARDLVRERRHYVRDRLAGLRPAAYLGAKTLVQSIVGLVQILTLLVILRLSCRLTLDPAAAADLSGVSLLRWSTVLMLSYLGGVALGFLTSTLVRTEGTAVAILPLLIMPQLLLSAIATGNSYDSYSKPRPFRPLIVALTSRQALPRRAAVVDLVSMVCLSRPTALVAEAPAVAAYGKWIWIGDLCHLLILLLATWSLVFLAFQWAEQRWLRLIGL